MLKVLINSYACCPGMGSEPGMGWNWIVNLARYCELYVISEGEFKSQVESWLNDNNDIAKNLHFYWNPVPQSTRDKCWDQGDWSFYPLYKEWQKKTAAIARDICKQEKIDILHQLNMIGFREPGYLWQVSKETGIPFVWGPIGGLKMFPMAYAVGLKMKIFNLLKNAITKWQIKYDKRVTAAINQASVLVSSIPDSYNALKKYHDLESIVIPETGCFPKKQNDDGSNRFRSETLTILWVGKFDFRKRLDIALKSIASTGKRDIVLKVFGSGNPTQVNEAKSLVAELGIDNQVKFMGNCPNDVVNKEMKSADLFLFTSVSEDTSTVVLEAVSNGLPVLCFDICGMSAVIDEEVGRKVKIANPKQSVKDFAREIYYLYNNRDELETLSSACRQRAEELSWDNKIKKMLVIYNKAIGK